MKQVITAKLKLNLTPEQKGLVRQATLAYRDALNYTSRIAFENNKLSAAARLQKLVYTDIRAGSR
jgi:predicted transposase